MRHLNPECPNADPWSDADCWCMTRTPGAEQIAAERQRQIDVEGYTSEHDAEYHRSELGIAALCYLVCALAGSLHLEDNISALPAPNEWPWDDALWKPSTDPIRNLEKAGALIAAEIDRLTLSSLPIEEGS